jgi:alanine dehydrogenase
MLLLKKTPIGGILTMEESIEAVENSLRQLALGKGTDLPRRRIHHTNGMIFGLLPASLHGFMGAYLQTDLKRHLHGETIILYSVETGEPLILYQDCSINELRTGAAGGVGVKHLARSDARSVALLGSGPQAKTQLTAALAVRAITNVKVFSPSRERRDIFAREMSRKLNVEIRSVESPREAVEGADIVITATNSQIPVFEGAWLQEGTHVTSMANGDKNRPRGEIDHTTMRKSTPIFITSKETVITNESDIFRAVTGEVISWEEVREIGQVLLGRETGRTAEQRITLFKLQGLGIMDIAVGLMAYERLKGSKVAQEW